MRKQRRDVVCRPAVDLQDDIARKHARTIRRAALEDRTNQHARRGGKGERGGKVRGELLRFDAEPTSRHLSVTDDLLEHVLGDRYGNREADALRSAALRIDDTVDADQIAAGIDQRTAGIAGVDGGVGLDEVLEGTDAQMISTQRAHNSVGH